MSRTAGLLRAISVASAAAGIGLLVWWFVVGQGTFTDPADSAEQAPAETASAQATASPTTVPAPTPTATAVPTPTPVPTPLPFVEAIQLGTLAETLASPMPGCGLLRNDEMVAGTVALTCIEAAGSLAVVAAADGLVVDVVSAEAVPAIGDSAMAGEWSWADQAQLGPHVVIDHGAVGGASNVQTVYAGLAAIEEGIEVGAAVVASQPLGTVAGPQPSLRFSVWTNDIRQDGARTVADPPPADGQRAAAQALRDIISSPTDPQCPLVLSSGSLPGASRDYRNGTHRGIDFGCGAADRFAHSIADGTVVYLVDDYQDATVPGREALLQRAGIAGSTPHWTLVMLYGNVVVIDHGEIPGAGRVVTISAHLEQVDEQIKLGAKVTGGQVLGEMGNRGTNASAQGIRGAADPTLHLHWELFIDNWYLGAGLDAGTTIEVVTTALCGAAQTAGCPG